MTQINFERLDAAITHAVENPDEFDMGSWFERSTCGTTACLAGTVAVQAGWTPVFGEWLQAEDVVRDGVRHPVWDVARELLGFSEDDADRFFYATGIGYVIVLRNRYAAERGVAERSWGAS